ncbi:hypothetical protein LQW54_002986 [Pestalotiopsis sp. IQ-011]
MASPEDHQDTALTQSPSNKQSISAGPLQDHGTSRPASKQSFVKDQLQVGWTFGRLDSLLSEKEPSEMESENQHKTAAASGLPRPLLDAITDDLVAPETSAVPSLDDQDLDLGIQSYPTPGNSDMEDDPPVRVEPAKPVEHEQSGESSEPLSVEDQEDSTTHVHDADNDDGTSTAVSAATCSIADARVNGDDDEGSSATPQTKDTQSDARPEAIAAPVADGTKLTKNGHDHVDEDKTSDPHVDGSSFAPRSLAGPIKAYKTCVRCNRTMPPRYFFHFRLPSKTVKTCSSCRELVNEKVRAKADARRMSTAASRDKKRSERTMSTGSVQLETSTPLGLWTVPAAGMDLDEDDQEGAGESRPKKVVHICPACDEAMPEDKFLRDGYSMRSCNDCAARENPGKATPPEEDDSRTSTSESQVKGTRDALTEADDDAVQAIVSQMRSNSSTKRQRGSVDDETVSAKKPKTHESPRLEIEDAGFLDLGVPEQARRARDDDVDELSDAFMAFPAGSDGQVGSQQEPPSGATAES